jgi:hypothetical protein
VAALFWVRRKSIFATGQLKTNIPSEGDTFESLLPSRLLPTLVQSGQVKDYRELARLAQVSTARVAQIIVLAQLAASDSRVCSVSVRRACRIDNRTPAS